MKGGHRYILLDGQRRVDYPVAVVNLGRSPEGYLVLARRDDLRGAELLTALLYRRGLTRLRSESTAIAPIATEEASGPNALLSVRILRGTRVSASSSTTLEPEPYTCTSKTVY